MEGEREIKQLYFSERKDRRPCLTAEAERRKISSAFSNADTEPLALDLPNNKMIGEFLAWALVRHNCGQIFPHMFTEFRKYRNSCGALSSFCKITLAQTCFHSTLGTLW